MKLSFFNKIIKVKGSITLAFSDLPVSIVSMTTIWSALSILDEHVISTNAALTHTHALHTT